MPNKRYQDMLDESERSDAWTCANLGGLTRLRIELSKLAAEPIAVRDVRRLHLLKSFDLLATEAADAALQ
jgi:hypothetical protein